MDITDSHVTGAVGGRPDSGFLRPAAALPRDQLIGELVADLREYAIFALDADGRVSSWSAGAQRVKGYDSEEIIGRHFSVFYPPEQVESGYPDWELGQAIAHGFFIDRGWRLRKDGTRFWAHVVITAQRAPDGSPEGFIKVVRDETEAHAQRQRSERRFADLFELAPVGIALLDQDERILDANGALCDLLGDRLHGKCAADLMHPSDSGAGLISRPADPAEPDREPVPPRVLARSDGQPVFCDVRCAASVNDDGNRFWLAVFQDVTEQVRHAETLHFQATHDQTTGLLNRQGVNELLAPMLAGCGGTGQAAVLFCDLDNFKRVNDSLGHDAGDELLVALAQRLATELPASCTPARLYGDEFLVVCSDVADCGGIDALTTTVSDLLSALIPLRDRLVSIMASIGAVTVQGGATIDEIISAADAAMFDAKRGHGRYTRTAPTTSGVQMALEEDLRDALRHNRLRLHYQPIVTRDQSIVLAEALVRWPHRELGPLAPDVILPVAEKGGLLPELDRWVLRTALAEATTWESYDGHPVGVTVNVSGLRPEAPDFADEISAAISDTGIAPDRVVVEVVETSLVDLPSKPCKTMRDLASTGVRFAMDDFGTGYSSLARLKDLPTQIVKLDQRFVSGMGSDPADLGIVRAVVELARAMRRTCIAEGVENTTQRRLLEGLGVDACQGFLFSRPLPAPEFRALLSTPGPALR
ncbi:PAS domain S-box-containing protein/diguanylate cyclase (GGDEF) domain-containing protein [Saccharopolyspora shandongensis]|uniref:PAS domain S-box-containing protein/diguanylate cyclase (GGDEF) domain-containing protein n=1 Tax=Saccharopolyspora shandongensis TaxID=418495 RepID=A0A1H3DBP8_9PSEU|nr:EAL domain-containing protein [Saccharopolyspora shandongensis]SDX63835.1 PAS domain S-box-containing protein/diguanylate cyclase (GGDEF) domain-containing protein [Saccharopolyspora shandongensis]